MTNPKIEHIANQNNLDYSYEEHESLIFGSEFPIMNHYMSQEHLEHLIELHIEFGEFNQGIAKTIIDKIDEKHVFSLKKKNMFKLLFSQTDASTVVNPNTHYSNKIQQLLKSSLLCEITRNTNFTPYIHFKSQNDKLK